jgi:methionyl-tRNA synthetase
VADFGPDALRYFLLREMAFGQDASFSDEAFLTRYNADLANDLGNTVSRVAALCRQSFGGTPNEVCTDNDVLRAYGTARSEWQAAMDDCQFNRALEAVWKYLAEINGFVVTRAPWKIRKAEGADSARLHRVLSAAAEGVRLSAVMLSPFVPKTSRKIFESFGLEAKDPAAADLDWGRLPVSRPMPEMPALFPRADADAYFKEKDVTTTPTTGEPAAAPAGPEERIAIEDFQKVRLRTAKIVVAERVPKSNKLMRLEVDLGDERRQIVAGIAAQYEPEALVGRNVVVVANLRPAKLMGVESNGMVLAASVGEAGAPVLLDVPADVPAGSKVK